MAIQMRPDGKIFAGSAKAGEVVDFPDIDRGWGVAFEQTGGVPPMEWFNSVGMRTDKATAYYLQHGVPEWAVTEDYPAGACVQYAGKTYQAKVAHQGKQPNISTTEWERWALSPGDITTPAQFDNSTKIATTEFVKKAGFTYSKVNYIPTSRILTATDIGSVIYAATSGMTLTVPAPSVVDSNMNSGDGFTVVAMSAGTPVTLQFSGCCYIYNGSKSTSITVQSGETISFCKNSATEWLVTGGTAAMGNIGSFGVSFGQCGYQKLPSGLILQWGFGQNSATDITVSFPIAFPNACLQTVANSGYTPGTDQIGYVGTQGYGGAGKTSFIARTSSSGLGWNWVAIGY